MDGDEVSSGDSDQEDEEKLPPSDPPPDDGDGNGGKGPPGGPPPGGPPNPGGPGGPGPPGPTWDLGHDDLAGLTIPNDLPQPDLSWWVEEEKVYKDKDILTVEVPDIPHDALHEPEFWSKMKSRVSTIDKSAQDHLTAWIDVAYSLLGTPEEEEYHCWEWWKY